MPYLNGPHATTKLMIGESIFVRSTRLLVACGFFMFLSPAAASGQVGPRPASGTYDLVALRVEFQPDTTRFTTGDGTFAGELLGGLESNVDPLPHDVAYFEAHLEFLRHYVSRVSDGKAAVETHLLPHVIRLSKPMGAFAPTGPEADSDAELAKLAAMVAEAWEQADAAVDFDMRGFEPGRTAFAIFHAGVGRDIELIGTTLDKTPQDLPSLFFDEAALGRLGADGLRFKGFPVDHTMILPRTETRPGTDFIADEPFLLELSINGLIAASFFNFLGVPDLFDTETGESAIGPFGLMDTQGIFAYRGLFPPEPMAWTKYYLGWTDPLNMGDGGPRTVSLAAASLPDASESARAVVSEAEYFLVENRYRDPEGDGLTLRIRQNGATVEQHFENGDQQFNGLVIDGFAGGVVVGVDNYDWALPGGVDEDGNELNGGMLIWHVDERRLRAGIPGTEVNNGTESRAVDLEEADGAQDIGFPSGPFGPQPELGSPFDFFYEGNPVVVITPGNREIRLYENRFGPNTFPSSRTNAGGPSFIVLEDFSAPAATMFFTYRREAVSGITPVELEGQAALQAAIQQSGAEFGPGSSVGASPGIPVVYSAGSNIVVAGAVQPVAWPSLTKPAVAGTLFARLHEAPDVGLVVTETSLDPAEVPQIESVRLPDDVQAMRPISPLVFTAIDRLMTYWVLMGDVDESVLVSVSQQDAEVVQTTAFGQLVGLSAVHTDLGSYPVVTGRSGAGGLEGPAWMYELPSGVEVGQPTFGRDAGGLVGVLPLTSEGEIRWLLSDGELLTIDVTAEARRFGVGLDSRLSAFPLLGDFDRDNLLDVLVAFGPLIFAYSQAGAVVRGFPLRAPARLHAQPLVMRFSGGEEWSVIAAAEDGYIYGFDAAGRRLEGFPLEAGDAAFATPLLAGNRLIAVSASGTVKAWELPAVEEVWWGELHRGGENASFAALSTPDSPGAPGAPLIDADETYNWPNPIRFGTTHLRVRTQRDARVEITIIDAGGGLVDELSIDDARAGAPAEIVWEADVQSGLYFARFTATTAEGESDTRVVKMAVLK